MRLLRRGLLVLTFASLAACASTTDGDAHASVPFGSLDGAVVATPKGLANRELVYFARAFSDAERASLASSAPHLRVVAGLSREEALARASEAHGADSFYATPEFVAAAPNLRWVHIASAGVDRYVGEPHLGGNEALVLTNARGVHGPAIADHVFAMLLALTRDLPYHLDARRSGTWNRSGSGVLEPIALAGRTCFVVGLGGIGSEVAQRAKGFDMRVVATRRSTGPKPDGVDAIGTAADTAHFLAEADVVVVCVPLTAETEGLFDADAFAAMKDGAYLVNIARGRVVDTDALVAALRSGRLAGACLDVTEPEPLPADHVLWTFPNVVVTPHVASVAELTDDRRSALFVEDLRRFAAGEPLLNVVDVRAGY
ncbi:MAG: D-2-hydroxyacid dehydrogenase [Planctomycetota bacterium]